MHGKGLLKWADGKQYDVYFLTTSARARVSSSGKIAEITTVSSMTASSKEEVRSLKLTEPAKSVSGRTVAIFSGLKTTKMRM